MKMTLFVWSFLVVGAFFAFLLSFFCLMMPNVLIKMNEWASRALLSTEQEVIKHRKLFGILMMVFGAFLSYVVYSTPLDLFPNLKH